jgi:hypothetical protein
MSMSDPKNEMRDDYDFSNARRGGHYREYREGHNVRVFEDDGSAEVRHFTLAEGAVMLDPDVKVAFPDSDAVNRALRSLVKQR